MNIDNVCFVIRKSTPKRYDRMSVFQLKDGSYKAVLTSYDGTEFEYYGKKAIKYLSAFINHEFLHIIICECVSYKCSKSYDNLLKALGKYTNDEMLRDWL